MMMVLLAFGCAIGLALIAHIIIFISAKIESKITFKEIVEGFKER